jgi:hypothetical protein
LHVCHRRLLLKSKVFRLSPPIRNLNYKDIDSKKSNNDLLTESREFSQSMKKKIFN